MYKILVCDPIDKKGIELLQNQTDMKCDVQLNQTPDALLKIIADYHAIIVRSETKLTAPIIEAAKNAKIIARAGIGVDNIDVTSASTHGIAVMNNPDSTTVAVAELTLSLMLTLARPIVQANNSLKKKEWSKSKFAGTELSGKTLGIIGIGRIGRAVASRASAFGMNVIAYDIFKPTNMDNIKFVTLDELLKNSDYISLHIPHSKETHYLLGTAQFAIMKNGVRIVNCARGGVIDESALYDALQKKKVAGVALDVFEKEPPLDSKLLELENVIVTPHIGASTKESQVKVGIAIAEQVIDGLRGKGLRNVVNSQKLPVKN